MVLAEEGKRRRSDFDSDGDGLAGGDVPVDPKRLERNVVQDLAGVVVRSLGTAVRSPPCGQVGIQGTGLFSLVGGPIGSNPGPPTGTQKGAN